MDRKLILTIFLIGTISVLIGALLKILSYGFSEGFMIFGFVLAFITYLITLIDVIKTSRDKSFWIMLFIFIPTIAPLIYLVKKKPQTEI